MVARRTAGNGPISIFGSASPKFRSIGKQSSSPQTGGLRLKSSAAPWHRPSSQDHCSQRNDRVSYAKGDLWNVRRSRFRSHLVRQCNPRPRSRAFDPKTSNENLLFSLCRDLHSPHSFSFPLKPKLRSALYAPTPTRQVYDPYPTRYTSTSQ